MTDRLRRALELIASGEGPQGGFLTRLQMMDAARVAIAPISHAEMRAKESATLREQFDQNGYDVFMAAKKAAERPPAIPENLEARLPGYLPDAMGTQDGERVTQGMASQYSGLVHPLIMSDARVTFRFTSGDNSPPGYVVDDLLK